MLLFCAAGSGYAQFESDYTPLKYSSSGFKPGESAFYKKLNVKFHTDDATTIKKYKQYLYQLQVAYANGSKDKQYIEEPFMTTYLQKVLDTIVRANQLKDKYQVVCTRYLVPNAFNLGDNRLYVNIALLELLHNEAELAFLLSHELSHQLLQHVQDTYIENDRRSRDKSLKKEIRDINKARYNKLDRSFQFMKNSQYDYARHSRAQEKAADSMAVILMQHTPYSLQASKTLLEILDHTDEDSTHIDYSPYLAKNGTALPARWTQEGQKKITFGNHSEMELDKDSSKTHPDIPLRKKMVDTVLTALNAAKGLDFLQPEKSFDSVRNASRFEVIEAYMKRKRYGAVVYFSLRLLKQYPENKYLYKQVALALNELNKAIAKHTVQNYLPIESDDFSEGYNHLLRIIDRTTATEFEELLRNYMNSNYHRISSISEIQSIHNELSAKNK
ncbi:MAG TPA: M48 family metalloprotease [Chitinophagaceae bacterium]|nr:M48 family metalloprotease [Chitinophagaceae bacterium]